MTSAPLAVIGTVTIVVPEWPPSGPRPVLPGADATPGKDGSPSGQTVDQGAASPGATQTSAATSTPSPTVETANESRDWIPVVELAIVALFLLVALWLVGDLMQRRFGQAPSPAGARKVAKKGEELGRVSETSGFVRSLLALWLVIGLLGFTMLAFVGPVGDLRSTLVGAITACTGTVVAFYFSSKASDQARKDILTASGVRAAEVARSVDASRRTVEVPDLTGLTHGQVAAHLAAARNLACEFPPEMGAGDHVTWQWPRPGTLVEPGTVIGLVSTPHVAAAGNGANPVPSTTRSSRARGIGEQGAARPRGGAAANRAAGGTVPASEQPTLVEQARPDEPAGGAGGAVG